MTIIHEQTFDISPTLTPLSLPHPTLSPPSLTLYILPCSWYWSQTAHLNEAEEQRNLWKLECC